MRGRRSPHLSDIVQSDIVQSDIVQSDTPAAKNISAAAAATENIYRRNISAAAAAVATAENNIPGENFKEIRSFPTMAPLPNPQHSGNLEVLEVVQVCGEQEYSP